MKQSSTFRAPEDGIYVKSKLCEVLMAYVKFYVSSEI